MKKKFRIDPSRQLEVAKALENLKNDTLQAISADMVSGGSTNATGNFSKTPIFSQVSSGWVKDAYILS